ETEDRPPPETEDRPPAETEDRPSSVDGSFLQGDIDDDDEWEDIDDYYVEMFDVDDNDADVVESGGANVSDSKLNRKSSPDSTKLMRELMHTTC
ncbi:hypothetical protein TNIN_31891, partial [Trichonephila inaurata madagascariensis]